MSNLSSITTFCASDFTTAFASSLRPHFGQLLGNLKNSVRCTCEFCCELKRASSQRPMRERATLSVIDRRINADQEQSLVEHRAGQALPDEVHRPVGTRLLQDCSLKIVHESSSRLVFGMLMRTFYGIPISSARARPAPAIPKSNQDFSATDGASGRPPSCSPVGA